MVAVATTVDPRTRHRAQPLDDTRRTFEPMGGARDLMLCTDPEILLEGPAGTGKSYACLKKIDRNAVRYPGSRQLIVRKTRTSLTQTALVTFEQKVLIPGGRVRFHTTLQAYLYPNGSVVVVGGLDKDSKVMSSEYDAIYVQEATELEENDWEALTTRLRNGVIPHQQLIADCNPAQPSHWLNQRCNAGRTRRIYSRHEDNPTIWDARRGIWTPQGAAYITKLNALSGVRYDRLRMGKWVAAEGQVYSEWNPKIHMIDRRDIPPEWARYRVVDFGYRNPFVCQFWAMTPDGDLIRYRELYHTGWLVSDAAQKINRYSAGETFQGDAVCDHDAEDRATLEDNGIKTRGANKAVKTGIEAVQDRLRSDVRGRPSLYLMRDSLVEPDESLREAGKPTCTEEEIESYVWNDKTTKEEPHKRDDHGMDAMRYLVMHIDNPGPPAFAPPDADLGSWFRDGGVQW